MIRFTVIIKKFGSKGEKTGWTYFEVPVDIAQALKPENKKEFKVKGKLDKYAIKRTSLIPMGGGIFIMALNAEMRKAIGKKEGAMLEVQLTEDKSDFIFNADFIECLKDEPAAQAYFQTLTGSHQRYFSKWIDSAKTDATKTKRIAMAVNALARSLGYPEMIRSSRQ